MGDEILLVQLFYKYFFPIHLPNLVLPIEVLQIYWMIRKHFQKVTIQQSIIEFEAYTTQFVTLFLQPYLTSVLDNALRI